MPSIRTVERLVRRGFRPRMPKFIARSWLPVPLFSGALTPGMRLSTSRMVVAPVLAKSSRRITSRAPACSNTSFSRASPSQSPTTVRASSFGAGAAQRPAIISQRFYLQSAAVQQLLQAALDVVIAVQAVALLAARQAGVNRRG